MLWCCGVCCGLSPLLCLNAIHQVRRGMKYLLPSSNVVLASMGTRSGGPRYLVGPTFEFGVVCLLVGQHTDFGCGAAATATLIKNMSLEWIVKLISDPTRLDLMVVWLSPFALRSAVRKQGVKHLWRSSAWEIALHSVFNETQEQDDQLQPVVRGEGPETCWA